MRRGDERTVRLGRLAPDGRLLRGLGWIFLNEVEAGLIVLYLLACGARLRRIGERGEQGQKADKA